MRWVWQINPNTLFLVEGTSQTLNGSDAVCWGDGFNTNSTFLQQHGGSDPTPFFNTLLQKRYLNNVIISPHYYGPSISQPTNPVPSGYRPWHTATPDVHTAVPVLT